jgi:hypothetical protein
MRFDSDTRELMRQFIAALEDEEATALSRGPSRLLAALAEGRG